MQPVSISLILWLWRGSLLGLWCLGSVSFAQAPPGPNSPGGSPGNPLPEEAPNSLDRLNPILRPPLEPPPPQVLPREEPLPSPEELLPSPTPQEPPVDLPGIPGQITVKTFRVVGSTVFTEAELAEVTKPFTNRPVTFAELLQARSAITKLYVDNGYATSGAFIPADQVIEDDTVTIQVIEGALEEIRVTGNKRLNASYVRSRLQRAGRSPLKVDRLLEALQLLQIDPLIENLSAELSASAQPGLSLLEVAVTEADSFNVQVSLDNLRSPSIGSFQRQIQVEQLNLLGFGDTARLAYANTDGSNQINASYTVPVNASNGTVGINFNQAWSRVIEEPFDVLTIRGVSRDLNIAYRQPLLRSPNQEFALGLSFGRRESQTSIEDPATGERIDFPFPGSGSDASGQTTVNELKFAQEFTKRDQNTVLALRSELALGLDALGATDNVESPDGQFFLWRGQGQWVKRLAPDTLVLLRSNLQFADRPLPSLAQFGLGGGDSVRGYRQDLLLVDEGIFTSAEVRIPVLRVDRRKGILHLVPFLDFGYGWNLGEARSTEGSNTLLAGGLGLRWQWNDRITAQLDWGVPLTSVGTQSSGFDHSRLFFSITATPF
jgi:hemolysin activation/secretion protein